MNDSRILKITLFFFLSCLSLFMLCEQGHSLSRSFPKTDGVIRAQLQAAIAADPALSRLHMDIDTNQAVVRIKGEVDTAEQANRLIMLATSIAGVKSVDASGIVLKKTKEASKNKANNKPDATFSADSIINSQVLGLYIREGLIDDKNLLGATIQVRTEEGVVYLSGTVDSDTKAASAVSLAQTVAGVVKVESTLVVIKKNP